MKKLPCKNPSCGNRRAHYERQDEMRGTQMVEAPDHLTENDPVFCSFTCAIVDGWMGQSIDSVEQAKMREEKWRAKELARNQKKGG